MKPVSVDKDKCRLCGLCVETCGRGGIAIEGDEVVLGGFRCMECGHCVAICPEGALATEQGVPPEIIKYLLPSPEVVENFLRARRSHRRYRKKEVPREVVEKIIDAARYAPSGKNAQPFEFVAIHTPEARKDFTEACFACMGKARKNLHNPLWRWVVGTFYDKRVREPDLRRSVDRALRRREMGMDPLFFNAPLILLIHGPKLGATPKDDCCYALFHAVLMAESLGLRSCINGNSVVLIRHFPRLRDRLCVPEDRRVYAAATFGYAVNEYERTVHRRPPHITWL